MTPGARIAAAIEVLDLILDGSTPEKALTGWGRSHRFAGSKDRAAIRDHVFGGLRCRASYAWIGGAVTGRGIMLGATHVAGTQNALFSGEGHAPPPRLTQETPQDVSDASRDVALDMPAWLLPRFDAALGDQSDAVLRRLQTRAAVVLRVNIAQTSVEKAIEALAQDAIVAVPIDGVKTALHIIENERRISQSAAYLEGLVELQDTSSQVAVASLDLSRAPRVLDLCAGGGGKALALAALGADVTAHDIDPKRMVDLAPRAARAGVSIKTVTTENLSECAPFDLVFCDAPCSGSGTWRRTPAAKWALSETRLTDLTKMQDSVLDTGADLVRVGGTLAYATCSVFECENSERVKSFTQRNSSYALQNSDLIVPHDLGDGFFMAKLTRLD